MAQQRQHTLGGGAEEVVEVGQAHATATAAVATTTTAATAEDNKDGGEAAVTAAVTAGLTPDGRAIYTRAAQDAPALLRAAYTPLERERDPMFVTPAALSW